MYDCVRPCTTDTTCTTGNTWGRVPVFEKKMSIMQTIHAEIRLRQVTSTNDLNALDSNNNRVPSYGLSMFFLNYSGNLEAYVLLSTTKRETIQKLVASGRLFIVDTDCEPEQRVRRLYRSFYKRMAYMEEKTCAALLPNSRPSYRRGRFSSNRKNRYK